MDNNTETRTGSGVIAENTDSYQETKEMGKNLSMLAFAVIASLVGAVAGSLPLLVQIFITGKASPFLYIVIPCAIVFFMITFKSAKGTFALVLIFVFSLVAVLGVSGVLASQSALATTLWQSLLSTSFYSYLFIIIGAIVGYEFLMNDKINPPRE